MPDQSQGPELNRTTCIDPDAHGQAALLLIESLIHALMERSVLSLDDAIGVIQSASEVKEEIADAGEEAPSTARHSLELLTRIANSLSFDRSGILSS